MTEHKNETFRVYVAGPLTKGDPFINVRLAIDAAERLRDLGFAPFIPHLYAFWHLIHSHAYENWMEIDVAWLQASDCVFRIPGDSSGADREVAIASELGIPVFYAVRDIENWLHSTKKAKAV